MPFILLKQFYIGNLKNAEKLVIEYNERLNKDNLKVGIEIMNELLTIYDINY